VYDKDMTRPPKKPAPLKRHPLYVVRKALDMGIREVAVAVSGGKDSVAVLDVCCKHFSRVEAYFMYLIPDLSFQEKYLRYLENRYKLTILRLPHWALSHMFRDCIFRHATRQARDIKLVRIKDVECYVRRKFKVEWIATGEKCRDSMERNAQLVMADGVSVSRHRIWPIAWWTHYDVFSYLNLQGILPSPEYKVTADGKSFGSLWGEQIAPIAEHYPEDFEKIKAIFPLIEAQVVRYRMRQQRTKDESQGGEDGSGEARQAAEMGASVHHED
jgi:phosphoadenosine phosphosulfate reductase